MTSANIAFIYFLHTLPALALSSVAVYFAVHTDNPNFLWLIFAAVLFLMPDFERGKS